jgi:hypothetical protein
LRHVTTTVLRFVFRSVSVTRGKAWHGSACRMPLNNYSQLSRPWKRGRLQKMMLMDRIRVKALVMVPYALG